jgi:hypothetical protein
MKKLLPFLIVLVLLVSCNLPLLPAEKSPTETAQIFPSATPQVIVVTATPQPPEPTARSTSSSTSSTA